MMPNQFEQIADGLAEDGFSLVDAFLIHQEVAAILQTEEVLTRDSRFKKAGIGRQQGKQINESIRGDYIHWLEPSTSSPAISLYLDRLRQLIDYLNQSLFLSLKDVEVHLTSYPLGTFYKRHLDQFKSDDHRKLSALCYLNEDWQEEHGGQLRMYLPNGPKDVLPLAGRLVCFRSDLIEHEVLPATRERLALTGWMVDRKIDY